MNGLELTVHCEARSFSIKKGGRLFEMAGTVCREVAHVDIEIVQTDVLGARVIQRSRRNGEFLNRIGSLRAVR